MIIKKKNIMMFYKIKNNFNKRLIKLKIKKNKNWKK